ncbi:MAG: DNA polymerase III subunit gamma/tau [Lachnospiraceae bacterium]|nr:DNA polymerase III subunit gamma/tau [Lachnospiraceae bacterium]
MAYTALYRKWRPKDFEDVKGQDHIVTALKNQIKTGRIGHAYLFCGTRGTGKTTIAKILAKAVNCEHPVDGSPCGECAVCRSIDSGSSMNVVEIDAASNNGVDNIREIRETVQYSPSEGRYRVYIIDEVHMLSTGAFNALLKTLEEPPSYVIFILATTEAHKIPVTVLSRCQRYDFRRISGETIAMRLKEMAGAEGIEADDDAIRYVAKKGDGSLRDAISLFDQCVAFYYGQRLDYDKVLTALGAVDNEVFSAFFRNLIQGDVTGCVKQIDNMILEGREIGQFVSDFIWYLRNMLLIGTAEVSREAVDMSSADLARLEEDSRMIQPETIIRYIRVLSELSSQMRYSNAKRVLLEITVIKLTHPQMEPNLDSLLERVDKLEAQLKEGVRVSVSPISQPIEEPEPVKEKKTAITLPKAQFEDLQLVRENWRRIIASADLHSKVALDGSVVEPLGEGQMVIVFTNQTYANIIGRDEVLSKLSNAVKDMFHKELKFKTRIVDKNYRYNEYLSNDELESVFNSEIVFSDSEEEGFSEDAAEVFSRKDSSLESGEGFKQSDAAFEADGSSFEAGDSSFEPDGSSFEPVESNFESGDNGQSFDDTAQSEDYFGLSEEALKEFENLAQAEEEAFKELEGMAKAQEEALHSAPIQHGVTAKPVYQEDESGEEDEPEEFLDEQELSEE